METYINAAYEMGLGLIETGLRSLNALGVKNALPPAGSHAWARMLEAHERMAHFIAAHERDHTPDA